MRPGDPESGSSSSHAIYRGSFELLCALSSAFFRVLLSCPSFSCWWGSGGVAPRARAGLFEMCSSSSSSFVPLKFVFPRENFILSILGREKKERIDYLLVSRDSIEPTIGGKDAITCCLTRNPLLPPRIL